MGHQSPRLLMAGKPCLCLLGDWAPSLKAHGELGHTCVGAVLHLNWEKEVDFWALVKSPGILTPLHPPTQKAAAAFPVGHVPNIPHSFMSAQALLVAAMMATLLLSFSTSPKASSSLTQTLAGCFYTHQPSGTLPHCWLSCVHQNHLGCFCISADLEVSLREVLEELGLEI